MEFTKKWLWDWFWSLSIPLRLLTGALVATIGGGYVGFLSEFAAYNYAIYYGFRPPLEGIPYLRVSVMVIAFLLYLGSALTLSLIILVPKLLTQIFDIILHLTGMDSKKAKNEIKVFPIQSPLLRSIYFLIGIIYLYLISEFAYGLNNVLDIYIDIDFYEYFILFSSY